MQDKLLYVMAQLDKETCEKMRGIDRLLYELGIEVKKPPKVPYHITLGCPLNFIKNRKYKGGWKLYAAAFNASLSPITISACFT